jgi:hypothetical protein
MQLSHSHQKTSSGELPLQIAFASRCPNNLLALLRSSKPKSFDVKFNEILNSRFDSKSSLLHLLAGDLSAENYENTRELMEILVWFGCLPSLRNEKNMTASDIVEISCLTSAMKKHLRATLNWRETAIDMEKKSSMFGAMQKLLSDENVDEFAKNFAEFRSSCVDVA